MTLFELLATACGGGAVGAIANAFARGRSVTRLQRRDEQAHERTVMQTLQDIAERSDAQHRECRREVDVLRGQLREQSVRIATAEGHYAALRLEHAQCPERIAQLERELRDLERRTPAEGIPSSVSHPTEET